MLKRVSGMTKPDLQQSLAIVGAVAGIWAVARRLLEEEEDRATSAGTPRPA